MRNNKVNYKEYGKLGGGFYGWRLNGGKWVGGMKGWGGKYICLSWGDEEGFWMFDRGYWDYNIVEGSGLRGDVVKELGDECDKEGIGVDVYY